jgi:hypothetical protein
MRDRIRLGWQLIEYWAGISVLISRPTLNVHLTASVDNAPSNFSVLGCFQWAARGQSLGLVLKSFRYMD